MAKVIQEAYLKTGENTWETYRFDSTQTEELSINISTAGKGWVDNTTNSIYYNAFNTTNYLAQLKELLEGAKQISAFIRVDWNGKRFEFPTSLETYQTNLSSNIVPFFKFRASATAETNFVIGAIGAIGVNGVYFPYTSENKNVLFRRLDDWEMYDGIELVVRVMK